MLPIIRKVVLVGVTVTAVAAAASCGQPDAQPQWAGSVQGLETPSGTPAQVPSPTETATAEAVPSSAAPSSAKPSSAKASASTAKVTYTYPVVGGTSSYAHTHHDYQATDIMTACGHTFVAVTSGVVLTTMTVDTWTAKVNAGATRGGRSVAILGDDGVRYYGSHLAAVRGGIKPGVRVKAGQPLGTTGESGDASACHVHFGISPPCARTGDWWTQRGAIFPWPYLDSWKKGGQKSPVAAVAAWKKKNGCPTAPTVDK